MRGKFPMQWHLALDRKRNHRQARTSKRTWKHVIVRMKAELFEKSERNAR